jgi:membrane protease YdiL (CAAX protease family)
MTLFTLEVTVRICEVLGYFKVQKHVILERLALDPPLRSTLLLIIAPVVGASLAEELIFRGILQGYLVRLASRMGRALGGSQTGSDTGTGRGEMPTIYGRWLGIVGAGIFFTLMHADWQHMPALFVLGLFLGYFYERYGNLLIPILIHCLFNILPLVLTVWQVSS